VFVLEAVLVRLATMELSGPVGLSLSAFIVIVLSTVGFVAGFADCS
jgi:hypothetical protein